MAAPWSSLPITTRSGCRKSLTAEPSRRNSGLDTTNTSLRPSACSTRRVEPTGTVDLLTTMELGRQDRGDLGGRRLDVAEVGRAVLALGGRHAQVDELGVRGGGGRAQHEAQPARVRPSRTSSAQPGLEDGDLAPRQPLDLLGHHVGAHDAVAEVGEAGAGRQARRSRSR